jgi:uncharacterized protein (TIGR03435 family)
MRRVVLDQTGLSGDFNFALEFVDQPAPGATDLQGPNFLDALEETLGLKMEPRKAPGERAGDRSRGAA